MEHLHQAIKDQQSTFLCLSAKRPYQPTKKYSQNLKNTQPKSDFDKDLLK